MPRVDGLSERELDVLRLLATDQTGPQIARELFVSVNTLRTHTKHIFTKLDVTTRRAAVAAPPSSACSSPVAAGITTRITSLGDRVVTTAGSYVRDVAGHPRDRPRQRSPIMTITTSRLTQAAGIATAVAGTIFIAVQINHPAMDVASVTTTDVGGAQTAKTVMAAARAGRHHRHVPAPGPPVGVLGLVGYLLFGVGYLFMFSIEVIGRVRPPDLAHAAPGYVNDVVVAAHRRHADG